MDWVPYLFSIGFSLLCTLISAFIMLRIHDAKIKDLDSTIQRLIDRTDRIYELLIEQHPRPRDRG